MLYVSFSSFPGGNWDVFSSYSIVYNASPSLKDGILTCGRGLREDLDGCRGAGPRHPYGVLRCRGQVVMCKFQLDVRSFLVAKFEMYQRNVLVVMVEFAILVDF